MRNLLFEVKTAIVWIIVILIVPFIKFHESVVWMGPGWYVKNTEGVWTWISNDTTVIRPYCKWFKTEKDVPLIDR